MTFPKELKIGGFIVEVKEVRGLADPGSLNGEIILIDASMSPEKKWETLLHEIIHKINSELGEVTVEFFAQALFQVLHDNKMLK